MEPKVFLCNKDIFENSMRKGEQAIKLRRFCRAYFK